MGHLLKKNSWGQHVFNLAGEGGKWGYIAEKSMYTSMKASMMKTKFVR